MSTEFTEVHMGLGSWSLDLAPDPALWPELARFTHVLLFEGERHAYTGVLLGREPSERGYLIFGRSLEWWLGNGTDGPLIESRSFYSGANRLEDGGFDSGLDYWVLTEGSMWRVETGAVRSGSKSAIASDILPADDVLTARRPWPTTGGEQWTQIAYGARFFGGLGRVRSRMLFSGKFANPELLTNATLEAGQAGWSVAPCISVVHDPANARSGDYVMEVTPIPQPQLIPVPGFDGTGWTDHSEYLYDVYIEYNPPEALEGNYVMRCGPVTQKQILLNTGMETSAPITTGPRGGSTGVDPSTHPLSPGPARITSIPLASLDDPVTAYLERYGHESLEAFQEFAGLEMTGEADEPTLEVMARPRCGVPDSVAAPSFAFLGGAWEIPTIYWYLSNTGPFTQSEAAGAIVDAFTPWDDVLTGISFVETSSLGDAHIVFSFAAVDGPAGIAAYSYGAPPTGQSDVGTIYGDIVMDNAEQWAIVDPVDGVDSDFVAAMVHEIGHSLGLDHSAVSTAVMWPYLTTGRTALDTDDEDGILTLYPGGDPPAPGTPSTPPPYSLIPYWFQSNEIDTPSFDYYLDPGGGMDGSQAATTLGVAADAGIPEHKYLRGDSDADPDGVNDFDVVPDESYDFDAHVRATPGTDGHAYISLQIPHPTLINKQRWYSSPTLEGERLTETAPDLWQRLTVAVTVPPNRTSMNALLEVHNHHAGYWAWDNVTLTRTRGNRAQMDRNAAITLSPGSQYELAAMVRAGEDVQVGNVRIGAVLQGTGLEDVVVDVDKGSTDFEWARTTVQFRPDDGYVQAYPFVAALDLVGSPIWVDYITLTKLDNNSNTSTGTPFPVLGERSYTFSASVFSEATVSRGTIKLSVTLTGPGRPAVVVESPSMESTEAVWKVLTFDFTPPSGYTEATPAVIATDVLGGKFWVDDLSVKDRDTATRAFDAVSTSDVAGPWEILFLPDIAAPMGSTSVTTQVVVEGYGQGWVVDDVSLARSGVGYSSSGDVVRSLLTNPTNGGPLSVIPGSIHGPERIPFDWTVVDLHDRAALDQFSRAVARPPREWRTNPDGTYDWGTEDDIFVDHTPGSPVEVVLLEGDLDVVSLPPLAEDFEGVVTEVKLLGAEREVVNGPNALLTASASEAMGDRDFRGNPFTRTRLVTDSSVDQLAYGQTIAEEQLAANNHPVRSTVVNLVGARSRPAYGIGDAIYLYKPKSGLVDATRTASVRGRTINPLRARVLEMTTKPGPKWRAVLRRQDGTEVPIGAVLWNDSTTISLSVGEPPSPYALDAQGPDIEVQFLRDRAAKPR